MSSPFVASGSAFPAPSRFRLAVRWIYRNRSARPTPEGIRFILFTLAIGIAALNTGNNLLYLLLAMMLSLIVLSGVLSEQCLKRVAVRRRLPEHVFAGRPAAVTFTLINNKRRVTSFSLHVSDVIGSTVVDRGIQVPRLWPKVSVVQAYPLLVTRRGRYRLDGIRLSTRFPFGLFVKSLTVPDVSEIVVYPETQPVPDVLLRDLAALGQDQGLPRRGQGTGVHNLRPYQVGDDVRSIHWKTTARQSTLIVREPEAEDRRRVTLALWTVAPAAVTLPAGVVLPADHPFERAVTLVASLATLYTDRGYMVGLKIGPYSIPQETGKAHLYRMLQGLGLCAPLPASEAGPALRSLKKLGERTTRGELTILVLPWTDTEPEIAVGRVSRIIRVAEHR